MKVKCLICLWMRFKLIRNIYMHEMKNFSGSIVLLLFLLYSGAGHCKDVSVKPITGTWINLAYQDVRNKYTNPRYFDNTV